jgi:hypothetical protein
VASVLARPLGTPALSQVLARSLGPRALLVIFSIVAVASGATRPTYRVFERSMPPELIRGWISVRVKKARQNKRGEPRF